MTIPVWGFQGWLQGWLQGSGGFCCPVWVGVDNRASYTLTLGHMSGRACQAELSARVRQDQSPIEASLSPPFLSAGKNNSLDLE